MKSDRDAFEKTLRRHLSLFGSPSSSQLDASRQRIRERLQNEHTPPASDVPMQRRASRHRFAWRAGLLLATTTAAIAVMVTTTVRQPEWIATVEAADGSHYTVAPNALLRADDAGGSMLTLKDGSRVEMRSQSELSLERAADGIGIRLRMGDLIVDPAEPRDGNANLYVHTKDITISVTGTMFVDVDDRGSRLTVISGEVRVREGATEKELRRGEQISTSVNLAIRPLKEDIGWSRQVDAILTAFAKGMDSTAGPLQPSLAAARTAFTTAVVPIAQAPSHLDFEEASVKPCDPDHLPQTPDGGRGGGANSFQLTPGRLRALCMTTATLIRTAWGYGPVSAEFLPEGGGPRDMAFGNVYGLGQEDGRRVRGGPDWMRSERYTIEAVASPRSTPDAQTLRGPMLQRLLERRFQVKVHLESEQAPAMALTVAKGGLKIKPVGADACQPLPGRAGQPLMYGYPANVLTPPRRLADVQGGAKPSCGQWGHRNGPNMVIIGGAVPLESLLFPLGARLGRVRVLDRTGTTDRFNFVLEFALDENTPGIGVPELPDRGAELTDAPLGATIFTALEEQLGLTLERAQAPREFIVIENVARPDEN